MKRSEFVAKLHSEEDPWVTSVVELAEAAGVTWDPEEALLPKRITWRRYASPLLFPVDGPGIFVSPQEEDACYNEAARRYNAWPELRHIAANLLDNDGSSTKLGERLLAILDGKDGGS